MNRAAPGHDDFLRTDDWWRIQHPSGPALGRNVGTSCQGDELSFNSVAAVERARERIQANAGVLPVEERP